MMPTARNHSSSQSSRLSTFPPIGSGTGLDDRSLRHLVRDEPLIIRPDSTLRDTLFALNQVAVQAGVVAEQLDAPLGIVTLHDVVKAITLKKADLGDPTFAFMTAAPVSLPADASVHRARVTMTRARLSHLVLVEANGRLCGLLAPSDLPGHTVHIVSGCQVSTT